MARFDSEDVCRGSIRRTALKPSFSISHREVPKIILCVIFMLAVLLLGMYLGWWTLKREEENALPDGQQAQTPLLQKNLTSDKSAPDQSVPLRPVALHP
jgi:cytochrome oxidase assembly protein ShyY1